MTTRDLSERKRQDQLDSLIRWTLRESFAHAAPPADAWERIHNRISQEVRKPRAAWWREFRIAFASAAVWLLESAVGPPAQLVYCDSSGLVQTLDKYELHLLMYQQDSPMLLGQVL